MRRAAAGPAGTARAAAAGDVVGNPRAQAAAGRGAGGQRFLLQGGDCAESFGDCTSGVISNRLKVLLQMSLVLVHGLRMPVVRVGRFAGQYAKPRSAEPRPRDGVTLPSYRGDIVNAPGIHRRGAHAGSAPHDQGARALGDDDELRARADRRRLRRPAPSRILGPGLGRAFAAGRRIPAHGRRHRRRGALHGDAVRRARCTTHRVDFYTSHEALLLPYEQAQTRQVPRQWGWFNLSTHFPWIGMRTAALDGAHVEYFRGIRNPIAVKVGPSVTPEQLLRLIDVLNPDDEPGRLTLIHRMGAAQVARSCRRCSTRCAATAAACCGSAIRCTAIPRPPANGFKTRRFDNIRSELEQAFDMHAAAGTRLGGVHLELTGENVTECLGGARDLTETRPRARLPLHTSIRG